MQIRKDSKVAERCHVRSSVCHSVINRVELLPTLGTEGAAAACDAGIQHGLDSECGFVLHVLNHTV